MLTFNTLLEKANIGPAGVVVFRHRPPQPMLQKFLPSLRMEQPELFDAYQSLQGPRPAAMLKGSDILAAFIGQSPGRATFAGLWRRGAWRKVQNINTVPGSAIAKLIELGMVVHEDDVLFDLQPMNEYLHWLGRLEVLWPTSGINWKIKADRHDIPIDAILGENSFLRPDVRWDEAVFNWKELGALTPSWRSAMSQWRGVYYIYDEVRRAGYVGSATGEENILQRWLEYARTGHGGNVGLRDSKPENLKFSILQVVEPSREGPEVVALENNWMKRLSTRQHGLNS